MKSYVLLLDLKEDEALIREYEELHKNVWPQIKKSITDSGIHNMEIYRVGNRLVMHIQATDSFSFEKKSAADASNAAVQQWESLMWKYQQALPWAKEGEKWMIANKIFEL